MAAQPQQQPTKGGPAGPKSKGGGQSTPPTLTLRAFLDENGDYLNDEVVFILHISAILSTKKRTINPVVSSSCLLIAMMEIGRHATLGFLPCRWLAQAVDGNFKSAYEGFYNDYIYGDVTLDADKDKSLLDKGLDTQLSGTLSMILHASFEKFDTLADPGKLLQVMFDFGYKSFERLNKVGDGFDKSLVLSIMQSNLHAYMPVNIVSGRREYSKRRAYVTAVDEFGSVSERNPLSLGWTEFDRKVSLDQSQLQSGYYHLYDHDYAESILFVVAAKEKEDPEQLIATNLTHALQGEKARLAGQQLWLPLVGSLVSSLTPPESFAAVMAAVSGAYKDETQRPGCIEIAIDPEQPVDDAQRNQWLVDLENAFGMDFYPSIARGKRGEEPDNTLQQVVIGYNSDSVSGKLADDHLKVRNEVIPIANVLCAKAMKPPLAIGLFGDWGSGKSFFIRQLKDEIREIVKDSKAAKDDKQCAYYSQIAQIEFNAWHYSEGNLWASLVEHIFTELRRHLGGKGVDEAKKAKQQLEYIVEQLETNLASKQDSEEALEQINKEIDTAEAQRKSLEKEQKGKEALLLEAMAVDVWEKAKAELSKKGSAYDALKAQLDVGLSKNDLTGDSIQEVMGVVEEVRGLWGKVSVIGRSLNQIEIATSTKWLFFLLVLFIICIGPAIIWGFNLWLGETAEEHELSAFITQVTALLGGGWMWLKAKLPIVKAHISKADSFIGQLAKAEQYIQQQLTVSNSEKERDIEVLSQEIAQLKQRKEAQQAEVARHQRRLDRLTLELQRQKPEARLGHFIEQRANSGDYREKLGIMAMVRRDFEKLTELLLTINDPNEDLQQLIDRGELAIAAANNNDPDKIRKLKDKMPKVERIILYIDDLDRCKEDKVLEVLQAVHLLLAFKLFVVVVAVDSRWVQVSLENSHPQLYAHKLLKEEDKAGEHSVKTTPADYLEKIFQVSYWVPEFDGDASKLLVNALFKDEVKVMVPPEPSKPKDDPDSLKSDIDREQWVDLFWRNVNFAGQHHMVNALDSPAEAAVERPEKRDINPDNLSTTVDEFKALNGVAVLAGTTPRQVKRFANLYRIFKARFGQQDLKRYLEGGDGVSPGYPGALVLLAIVTGAPRVCQPLLCSLSEASVDLDLVTVELWIKDIKAGSNGFDLPKNDDMTDALNRMAQIDKDLLQLPLSELARYKDIVARFSFERL